MSRDSPEATDTSDMSHVLPWSHAPNSPGLHLSTFTLYNLQNEWVRPGGQWGWRWRFRPCFSCFLLAQKLWVHLLWIWKSQVRPFLEQKTPWRWSIHVGWHFLCTGQVIIRDRKSYKGGIQLWMFQWFFLDGKFEAILLICIMALGKTLRKHSNVPFAAFWVNDISSNMFENWSSTRNLDVASVFERSFQKKYDSWLFHILSSSNQTKVPWQDGARTEWHLEISGSNPSPKSGGKRSWHLFFWVPSCYSKYPWKNELKDMWELASK